VGKEVGMSRTFHHGERKIRVRAIRKDPPDLRRLARALIALVEAEAEAEFEEQARKMDTKPIKRIDVAKDKVLPDDKDGS
jgi:hypothetical protein